MRFLFLALFWGFNIYNISDVKSYAITLDRVEGIMSQLKYKTDAMEGRIWRSPYTTLSRGWGDCADFALLSEDLLTEINYDCTIYIINYDYTEEQHAILEYSNEREFGVFSNTKCYRNITVLEYADLQGGVTNVSKN